MHRLPLDDLLDSYIPRYIVDITFIRFFPPGGNCDWMNLLLRLAHEYFRIESVFHNILITLIFA